MYQNVNIEELKKIRYRSKGRRWLREDSRSGGGVGCGRGRRREGASWSAQGCRLPPPVVRSRYEEEATALPSRNEKRERMTYRSLISKLYVNGDGDDLRSGLADADHTPPCNPAGFRIRYGFGGQMSDAGGCQWDFEMVFSLFLVVLRGRKGPYAASMDIVFVFFFLLLI